MTELNGYELEVLRAIDRDNLSTLIKGAALNACIEFLEESGYVTGRTNLYPTKKGWKYLNDHSD